MKKVDHIGIAVQSIDEVLPFYTEMLALTHIRTEDVSGQRVKVAFIDAGNIKLELLEPTDDSSPIARFLQKKGQGIHHIAFQVEGIEERIRELSESLPFISETPSIGAGGAKVAFMHPKATHGVLYELCDHTKGEPS